MDETLYRGKTAYIYARTSSDDGDYTRSIARQEGKKSKDIRKKESIEEQIRLSEAKCHSLGLTIKGKFTDTGFSGRMYPTGYEATDDTDCEEYFQQHIHIKKKKSRTDFGKLLDSERVDYLVVRDLSRVVRPYKDSFVAKKIWQLLRKKKTGLITTEEGEIDQDKFHDRLVRDLRMQIEDEIKQKEIQRCIQTLTANKNNGSLASGVKCLGFISKKDRKFPDPPAVIEIPDELKTVRLIFDKYLHWLTKSRIDEHIKKWADPDKQKYIQSLSQQERDEYNDALNLLQIANFLNDEKKIFTKEGNLWSVNQVRKILLRPWYAGLQYNTGGALIDSKVFPTGDKATITTDEFYRVQADFNTRKDRLAEKDPHTPGPAIGTRQEDGVCHPFSGLIRCGICGKHMYVSKVINPYYKDKILVSCFHYICKTPQNTKDPAYEQCKQSRIKEQYPQKSLELGITPNGLGLIEALFPLLFYGYIPKHIERIHSTPKMIDKRQQLKYQLDQLKEQDELHFSQQARKIIDDEQFAHGMARIRNERADLRKQLMEIEQQIMELQTDSVSIPDELFLDPKQMSLETMQELAHDIFKEILVYPDKITVVLKKENPTTHKNYFFDIGRVRYRNSRDLPFWKARINSKVITPETKVGVAYYYPSTLKGYYREINIPYHDQHLEVVLLGRNTGLDKKRSEPLPKLTWYDRHLAEEKMYGTPPGYGRQLEINSQAFFGSTMTTYPEEGTVPPQPEMTDKPVEKLPDDYSPFE
ncbi:MAG: hypothetical protein A2283_20675 [Lentisphaerae bacterium RIFOXYA12_FULL_48_11]|nr:MAG: hypothetical protein A2283_20675 [Lentisphaerae bacterium RIFOXYA12_FULL_48_11]